MSKAKRFNICLIPDGRGPVRNLKLRRSVLLFMAAFTIAGASGLVAYSLYAYSFIGRMTDRSEEMEALKTANAALEAQIGDFSEALETLNGKLLSLTELEEARAALTGELRTQLGLPPETPVGEVLAGASAAAAWAERSVAALGEEVAALTGNAGAKDLVRNLSRDLDRLILETDRVAAYLPPLNEGLTEVASILAATPSFLPLDGPISSVFGLRQAPFGGRAADFHRGLDIPAPIGSLILAPADGTVLASGQSGSGYGLLLTIDHGYGLVTRYGHLDSILVAPGQTVTRGQTVARSGNSGRSTGPHLHYEVLIGGAPVDPLKLLATVSPALLQDIKILDEASGAASGGRAAPSETRRISAPAKPEPAGPEPAARP